jgi:hypothetical protein
MRVPSALINDLLLRRNVQPKNVDAPYRRRLRYWILLGFIVFNIAFWTGIRSPATVL